MFGARLEAAEDTAEEYFARLTEKEQDEWIIVSREMLRAELDRLEALDLDRG